MMTFEERQAKREEIKKQLEALGVKEFSYYALINNYGYHFNYKEIRYDFRHWLNCYGADVDYWSISPKAEAKEFETITQLILQYDEI